MYKLYYWPGNANLAPHMVLEEIGVDYELILIDRNKNAHKSPEYLELNPSGRIPTLIDGDLVLFETAAICLHLADRHPDAGLAPALGSIGRAEFYKWLIYLTNTLQTEILTYYYPDRLTDDDSATAQVKKHAEERIGGMLDIIDKVLRKNGGPYLLGDHYSVADPYLLMLSRWTRTLHNPARDRDHLGRFLEIIADRPAVRRAHAGEGLEPPFF